MTRREEAQQIVAEIQDKGYALDAWPKQNRRSLLSAALALFAWACGKLEGIGR